ncbi:MAG: methyltransferase domain-containing protein [Leptothrix sp. (in: b-proteobacteria)]
MRLPDIHICIVQPVGYVHSLGFLDQARFFRHQFRRMGAAVTLAKNRLRADAVNVIFGAHIEFDPALCASHTCVFVNLEQLGAGGASVSPAYLDLLGRSAVIDYDAANVSAYTRHGSDVPLISFGHAPYLKPSAMPIERRPIDLLFFGSVNARRQQLFAQIEATGHQITLLSSPVYGPERDHLISQARAVFNCHFYESARFEQARAFQCLSLGTPVISERLPTTRPPAQFEDSVFWVPGDQVGRFFTERFNQPGFADQARAQIAAFAGHDVIDGYADALAFAAGYHQVHTGRRPSGPWQPRRLHIGSGKDYKLGWFNVDILASAQPDAVLDLAQPQAWPLAIASDTVGAVQLAAGSLDTVYANNVLEHVPDLPQLMGNCLTLLRDGGEMVIEVPYEHANTAWQDPTHVRAMNENSWIYYTDWFWYLGWFKSRFEVTQFAYLDAQLQPCERPTAAFMRVRLSKVATTLAEKMTARTMQAGFGGIPDDLDAWGADGDAPEDAAADAQAVNSAPPPLEADTVPGELAPPAFAPLALAPSAASSPVTAAAAPAAPATWVVLTPAHDDGVTQNFAEAIADGLRARGERAIVMDLADRAPERLAATPAARLAGVITIGSVPLALAINGVPLHRALACPVYMYLLDSPVYDLARVPATRQFIADAWQDDRLVPVLAERSYLELMRAGARPLLPPQSRYLPFAAFPAQQAISGGVQDQPRLLVIGTLGRELTGHAVKADLLQTLRDANRPALSDNELLRLAERLQRPDARGNVVADCFDALGLSAHALLDASVQGLVCAADSHLKRARRLAAVKALRGVPVDFIGPGWQDGFAGQAGFRFLGSVDHADLARLMPLYRGVVNFDPNWEWGQHDRVYTALACGVPVLTHANGAIAEEGLPPALLRPFAPNVPNPSALKAIGLKLTEGRRVVHTPVPLDRIGWHERVQRLLGAVTARQPAEAVQA